MRLAARTLLVSIALLFAAPAAATVTSSVRSVTTAPCAGETVFTVSYHFTDKAQLQVTKTLISTNTPLILTRGSANHYTVRLPLGSTNGKVTLNSACTSDYNLTIARVMPLTQTTSLKAQGSYSASVLEDVLDEFIMIAQQILADGGSDGQTAVDTHEAAADPHTVYVLLAGRAGGQHTKGGTASGENYQISSTSHATKGKILIGSGGTELVVDDVNNRVGIGTATPSVALDVVGAFAVSTTTALAGDATLSGGAAALTFSGSASSIVVDDNDATALLIGSTGLLGSVTIDTTDGAERLLLTGPIGLAVGTSAGEETQVWADSDMGGVYLVNAGTSARFELLASSDGTLANSAIINLFAENYTAKPSYIDIRGDQLGYGTNQSDTTYYVTFNSAGMQSSTDGTGDWDITTQGVITGRWPVETDTNTSVSLDATDCGKVLKVQTDNTVVSLPALTASLAGCAYVIMNTQTGGNALISVSPDASDPIQGVCQSATKTIASGANTACNTTCGNNIHCVFGWETSANEVAVECDDATADKCLCSGVLANTVGKDFRNPKATARKNDYIMVVASTGGGVWDLVGCRGLWEEEP